MAETPVKYLLDTSVVIKWFRTEEADVATALKLAEDHVEGRAVLLLADWLFCELANALRFKPGMTAITVKRALSALEDLSPEVVGLSGALMRKAVEVAYETGLTVYDALFIASAAQERVPLVTADRRLAHKAARFARTFLLADLA